MALMSFLMRKIGFSPDPRNSRSASTISLHTDRARQHPYITPSQKASPRAPQNICAKLRTHVILRDLALLSSNRPIQIFADMYADRYIPALKYAGDLLDYNQ